MKKRSSTSSAGQQRPNFLLHFFRKYGYINITISILISIFAIYLLTRIPYISYLIAIFIGYFLHYTYNLLTSRSTPELVINFPTLNELPTLQLDKFDDDEKNNPYICLTTSRLRTQSTSAAAGGANGGGGGAAFLSSTLTPGVIGATSGVAVGVGLGAAGMGNLPMKKKNFQCKYIYQTFMNEIRDYRPHTFHISKTTTIFVSLDGNLLHLQNIRARITKRALETDTKIIQSLAMAPIVSERIINLKNYQVVLKPDFLIHKRQWNKKYPICLISIDAIIATNGGSARKNKMPKKRSKNNLNPPHVPGLTTTSPGGGVSNVLSNNPSPTPSSVFEYDLDSSGTFNDPNNYQQHIIYLFPRTNREKEYWFRLLRHASLNIPFTPTMTQLIKEAFQQNNDKDDHLLNGNGNKDGEKLKENNEIMLDQQQQLFSKQNDDKFRINIFNSDDAINSIKSSGFTRRGVLHPKIVNPEAQYCYIRYMAKIMSGKQSKKGKNGKQQQQEKEKSSSPNYRLSLSDYVTCDPHLEWLNALLGRVLFDVMKEPYWLNKMKQKISGKLKKLHKPVFINDLLVDDIDLGTNMPIIRHCRKVSVDTFGLWIDFDIAYTGGLSVTIQTKLKTINSDKVHDELVDEELLNELTKSSDQELDKKCLIRSMKSAALNSDEEETIDSFTEDDLKFTSLEEYDPPSAAPLKGRLMRLFESFAKTNCFAKALENSYVKMGVTSGVDKTKLVLTVKVEHLHGVLCVNLPPPPSNRVWYGFREKPVLKLKATPRVGDKTITMARLVEWIENKIISEICLLLVFPNMDDFVIPTLLDNNPRLQTRT